ncbi:cbb3-type cytochrome oxidase subunit 3 [Halomonadaceae bacterium KBTZ08]
MAWETLLSHFKGVHQLLMIAIFAAICIWAFSPSRRRENEQAAHLVFEDEDMEARTIEQQRRDNHNE